jgi:HK97 family phage major capsid protein
VPSMTAAQYRSLLPVDVADQVIGAAVEQSAVMRASKVIRMSSGSMSLPLATVTPTAAFVNQFASVDNSGRKPFGEIQWGVQNAVAEEVAVVTAVPDAFVADATFDVWGNVRDRLTTELARTIDQAMLSGTGAPATWPVGGLAAAAAAPAATDVTDLNEILAAWSTVADRGGDVTAGVASPTGRAALLGMQDGNGRPLYLTSLSDTTAAQPSLLGAPIYISKAWNVPDASMIVGDFDYSIVGIRQDITWDMSKDGVIADATGTVVLSAFQDDVTLIRMYARIAYAIGKIGANAPFAKVNLGDYVAPVITP